MLTNLEYFVTSEISEGNVERTADAIVLKCDGWDAVFSVQYSTGYLLYSVHAYTTADGCKYVAGYYADSLEKLKNRFDLLRDEVRRQLD